MKRRRSVSPLISIVGIHFLGLALATAAPSTTKTVTAANKTDSSNEKSVLCDETRMQKVRVTYGRHTTLNFPGTPKDIIPGAAVFDFKRIRNDLAIISLKPGAHTGITVYLRERRCAFDLITVGSGGDDILFVKDPQDRQLEVKIQ